MKRLLMVLVVLAPLCPATAAWADHDDYGRDRRCYQYGDCRDRDRQYDNDGEDNRRAGISPGPFDRSPVDIHDNRLTVCFPFSRCGDKDDGGDNQPGPVQ